MMKYKYHVTTEVQKWWDKQNFGSVFQERLNDYRESKDKLALSKNVSKVFGKYLVAKCAGVSSRPTFVWEPWVKGDATLYVLRSAYVHKDYETISFKDKNYFINLL